MIFLLIILYIGLALMQSLLILALPSAWRLQGKEIIAWPLYSAWGIGWVITGLWFLFGWSWSQYWIIFIVFHACFLVIFAGAQMNFLIERSAEKKRLIKLIRESNFE